MCARGRFVAWELKVGKNTADSLQEYELKQIAKASGVALIVTPDNYEEAFEDLESILKEGRLEDEANRLRYINMDSYIKERATKGPRAKKHADRELPDKACDVHPPEPDPNPPSEGDDGGRIPPRVKRRFFS